ncbi:S-adenosyl-L-methionine-dependent methyltransferase [Polychaeton citri CBS 116435]|uniref:S-adenosyl-L-methionine-dependent methyltransferase n=1 Tax=Polychaeton citri CBS 116435 TaxID=1314669 RepID=A0A9P4Q4C9_9PEZI|nr:S-adenosyl-L-methionine-dependent methyltransferase [Polychaeton citri CBS 116435]
MPAETQHPTYAFGFKPEPSTIDSHSTRTAAVNCQYMLPALKAKVTKTPTLKLLDVGCGPGSITLDLSTYIPRGQVVGLDFSETVLDVARAECRERGVLNTRFVQGDVYHLPFADGEFDVVNTHQVVCHLARNVEGIRELIRVTKPNGGILCMREGILPSISIGGQDGALLKEAMGVVSDTVHAEGADRSCGLHLKAYALEAGVPVGRMRFSIGTWSHSTREEREELAVPWIGRAVEGDLARKSVEHGFTTREKLEEVSKAWARFCGDESACYCMMHGEVIIEV